MASHEFAKYKFEVKEFDTPSEGEAQTCLYCQPTEAEFSMLDDNKGHLSICFKKGVDVKKASDIAKILQENVDCFTITKY
ncbi:Uncharacterised protein [Raoultella terrigena]|uniref:hypothetical protein n=1 Tax=Raoultella terrigena TaxID=577 RepID=UPI000E00A25C|nr:hypothetical protein [Raoultella terrigena]SUQ58564.1 Uncharacterised protein [Raoultella terrigena]